MTAVSARVATRPVAERRSWRAAAVPTEHGGWGLTLEPALVGLLVAPSAAGGALAVAALVAFLIRTPIKIILVDRFRGRWLPRSRLALRIAAGEAVLLATLAVAAWRGAGWSWLGPVAVAVPLVAVELAYDMRSRSRRLVPELAGTVGIAATAAAVALAGGEAGALAVGLWLVVAGRGVASIPFVRVQIDRLRHGRGHVALSDAAQALGLAIAGVAVVLDHRLLLGAAAVAAVAASHIVFVRRPPVPAKVLGLRQLFIGLAVVAVTAGGVTWI